GATGPCLGAGFSRQECDACAGEQHAREGGQSEEQWFHTTSGGVVVAGHHNTRSRVNLPRYPGTAGACIRDRRTSPLAMQALIVFRLCSRAHGMSCPSPAISTVAPLLSHARWILGSSVHSPRAPASSRATQGSQRNIEGS